MPIRLKLAEFNISDTYGFLLENPLDRLPKQFDHWNEIAESMSDLYARGLLRERVKQMPVLDWTLLKGYREKILAHHQLTLITSAFVWQDGPENPSKMLPSCVALPLWNISQDLGIKPMISHPGFVLASWKLKDPSEDFALDNLECLYRVPGGVPCENIITIAQAMEKEFAKALKHLVDGAYSVDTSDCDGLTSAIQQIRDVLVVINHLFTFVHSRIPTDVFFKNLVSYIQGWGKEGTPLANGLVYEGVSDAPIKCRSYAASQSSMMQSLDAFLGITYDPQATLEILDIRSYMARDHRRFIETLEARPSTRDFVLQSSSEKLKEAYNDCLRLLTEFRSYHVRAVAKYIIVPAGKIRKESGIKPDDKQITDEAKLMSFLKGLRTETKASSLTT